MFLLCLIVYNANLRGMATSDAIPNMLVPLSILTQGTFTLDPFLEYFGLVDARQLEDIRLMPAARNEFYYLTPSGGYVHSSYPPALPLLVLPLFAPVVWILGAAAWPVRGLVLLGFTLGAFAASVIAALSAVAMLRLLERVTTPRGALVLTLVYAFATTAWTTSGEALWQQGASALFLLLVLHALAGKPPTWLRAGVCAALLVAIRPSNLLFWPLPIFFALRAERPTRAAAVYALPGVGVGLLLAWYNLSVFDDLRGGYAAEPFTHLTLDALAGLLISPSRGLLVFTPVLAFSAIGGWRALRHSRSERRVHVLAAAYVFTSLLLFAHLERWWGGASYGPRLLTESAAALMVLTVPALEWLRRGVLRRFAFAAAIAWSIGTQAVGAFCYPMGGWEDDAAAVGGRPGALWDRRDSQIAYAWRACTSSPTNR